MKLIELFQMGGAGFMLVVTICGILMLLFVALVIVNYFFQKKYSRSGLDLILLFGSLAAVIGFLGQAIGLISAFDAIEVAGDISPGLIAGGFKVSMIVPLYGTIIFIISLISWGVLREIRLRRTMED